ncbi:hypothetical protein GCM10008994_27740 [Halorubrum ejinorense]|uniref:Uncharacterized protein n=1 Tax=Halorubrum ejinorense TaxID=425309 RepID=A0AAV3SW20_9EURY
MNEDEPPVPEPVRDDATVELVCDAIGVARGEVPAKRFAAKCDTGAPGGKNEERGQRRGVMRTDDDSDRPESVQSSAVAVPSALSIRESAASPPRSSSVR